MLHFVRFTSENPNALQEKERKRRKLLSSLIRELLLVPDFTRIVLPELHVNFTAFIFHASECGGDDHFHSVLLMISGTFSMRWRTHANEMKPDAMQNHTLVKRPVCLLCMDFKMGCLLIKKRCMKSLRVQLDMGNTIACFVEALIFSQAKMLNGSNYIHLHISWNLLMFKIWH